MSEPQVRHINGDRLWREMIHSVNQFLAAEAVFDALKQHYRTSDRYDPRDEASRDELHQKDARTKQAISQAAYFRDRAIMFATAYQASQFHGDTAAYGPTHQPTNIHYH